MGIFPTKDSPISSVKSWQARCCVSSSQRIVALRTRMGMPFRSTCRPHPGVHSYLCDCPTPDVIKPVGPIEVLFLHLSTTAQRNGSVQPLILSGTGENSNGKRREEVLFEALAGQVAVRFGRWLTHGFLFVFSQTRGCSSPSIL